MLSAQQLVQAQPLKKQNYGQLMHQAAKDIFVEAVREFYKEYPELLSAFDDLLAVKESGDYTEFYQKLQENQELMIKILDIDAKMQDYFRRVRKVAANNVINQYKMQHLDQSHSLRSELKKAADAKISAEDLQACINSDMRAIFSLTGHPTSPLTLEYTKTGYELDKILGGSKDYTNADLKEAIKQCLATNMAGVKKTPAQEAEEGELALVNIYRSFSGLSCDLQRAIDESSYKGQIFLPETLLELCMWTHGGDADGNPNITKEVLEVGIKTLEDSIKYLYCEDLEKIDKEAFAEIIAKLREYNDPQILIEDIEKIEVSDEKRQEIAILKQKIKQFGFYFAKIDIRHNSSDLMKALNDLMSKITEDDKKEFGFEGRNFRELKATDIIQILEKILADENLSNKLKNYTTDQGLDGETKKILSRLSICAINPEKCDKLIIADAQGVEHPLTALLLLAITENIVAKEGAKIDVVTLSESIEDLRGIHKVQETLIANPTYKKHLEARRRLVQMIAKSDTIRVGGPGAEFYQDEAAGLAYLLALDAEKNLEVRVFNGGGAALQRGGGRPLEVPNRHAKSALDHGAEDKGPSLSTIQGHQRDLLFGSTPLAQTSLEEYLTQNLHSKLMVKAMIKSDTALADIKKLRQQFCDEAIKEYQDKYFGSRAINSLFANSNRIGVSLGNTSSRPNKRGKQAIEIKDGVRVNEVLTEVKDFDIFDTRAITLDRTLAHSGTFAVMFLGLKEAFAQIKTYCDKEDQPSTHKLYRQSKAFRDFIRNQIVGLFMVDLDGAWQMMVGQKRPEKSEIDDLATKFDGKFFSKDDITDEDKNKVVMAFLDDYINSVGKSVYETVANEKAPDNLDLKSILRFYSGDLYTEMLDRDKEAAFLRYVEIQISQSVNQKPDMYLTDGLIKIHSLVYAGTDPAKTDPTGLSTVLTSIKQRDEEQNPEAARVKPSGIVKSFAEHIEQPKFPLCLAEKVAELQETMDLQNQSAKITREV